MYNKIFSKILDSSVWFESNATRLVWITFLAAMDQDGMCELASPLVVAHRARVSVDEAEAALAILEAPDRYSSDTDHEGRRIERTAGGWLILNAHKYREISTAANKREKTRARVRAYRVRRNAVANSGSGNAAEAVCNAESVTANDVVTTSEAEAETETEEKLPRGKRERKEVHPLFGHVRDLISRYYRNRNQVEAPWGAGEARQLSTLLAEQPQAPREYWNKCILGRSESDVNHAERPRLWIANLPSYRNAVNAYSCATIGEVSMSVAIGSSPHSKVKS
ncbi:hypothetical protein SAMN05443244_2342 [Terriglobus roseus]|uniref:Uncharacterized protein n=1 Tax=Terriglobus roseus TaxID=392734 RepID=A0A1H4NSM3_9BACT|nr:hypothetical protein SAMN05443244_2342 [Terriglobus roseus]